MKIMTYTGVLLDPWCLRPDQVRVKDIAHSLALQCRFVGHSTRHYSIAEHCMNVARLLKEEGATSATQLAGLIHDAAEYVLGDVASPTKQHLPSYRDAEHRAEAAIREVLIPADARSQIDWNLVKRADRIMLVTEARDIMAQVPYEWASGSKTIPRWGRKIPRRMLLPRWRAERAWLRQLKHLQQQVVHDLKMFDALERLDIPG